MHSARLHFLFRVHSSIDFRSRSARKHLLRHVFLILQKRPQRSYSTTSNNAFYASGFRQEARDIIKNAVNASDDDAVIFVGHGCAGAIKKLVNALDLDAPTVFVGASEHQDNLQIWQEIGAQVSLINTKKYIHHIFTQFLYFCV